METHQADGDDRTDIELLDASGPLIIYEAKRGWIVPTDTQLATYARRSPRSIVVVTDCTDAYAAYLGLPVQSDGVEVTHRSWRHVLDLVRTLSGADRWIAELLSYLEANVATLQDVESNQVYCVSVGPIQGLANQHGREFVDQDVYFHPHAPGWPHRPPTYMAFRQSNEVFTIRHVDAYELVADLREVAAAVGIKKVLDEVEGPHFVYWLGRHIGPARPLAAGTNYRAARHWVYIDLLLTSSTYKEALAASKEREQTVGS